LNSKERVIRAIEFDGPDRVPLRHSYRFATLDRYGDEFANLLAKYPSDFREVTPTRDTLEGSGRGSQTDEWGITWVKIQEGYMGQPKGHPLESWDDLDSYEIPDPDPGSSLYLKQHGGRAESIASVDKYVCMFGGNLFERLQWLRGMRNVFVDLAKDKSEISRLADMIVDYNVEISRIWCERGADAIVFSDDWGSQTGLMINPSLWRKFFKPRYRLMFHEVKRLGAKVHFHSDGYILDIMKDLIDLGLDVLNPQLNVHDLAELSEVCGGRICIRGGLDRQFTLPRGNPASVRRHVLDAIETFGSYDGGWIACGELGPDVPFANCEEMMGSFARFGRYRP
jgi:hypothetical protein